MIALTQPSKLIASALLILGLTACNDDDDSNVASTGMVGSQSIMEVARGAGTFTTLVAALEATGLDQTLDSDASTFTVFAPTDDAFAKLGADTINALLADTEKLTNMLTYHVIDGAVNAEAAVGSAGSTVAMLNGDSVGLSLSGDALLVNASTVTGIDVMASNGIIHVIDAVLIPPASMGEPTLNIVETAVAAGSFGTLVTALQAAGLDTVLADPNTQFTVFAPTDDAFAKLGADAITLLLADTTGLTDVLLQHVVSGAAVNSVSAYTLNGKKAATAGGKQVAIDVDTENDTLRVGGAVVITKDIYTTNGVIHVIDSVITNGTAP